MTFKYIITDDNNHAMPAHSKLTYFDMQRHIRSQTRLEDGDYIWMYGARRFVNPKVMIVEDYIDHLPALIIPE